MDTNFKNHFILMAGYNTRMNLQVYETASNLTETQLKQDVGAFFGSIFATLNHVFTGDLLWLERFQTHPTGFKSLVKLDQYPAFKSLDQIAYQNFEELVIKRKELDQLITDWVRNDISEQDFHQFIEYSDTRGTVYKRNFAELLFHFFNHQTHHRGQLSTMFSQFGHDVGITDFLIDIPGE